MGVGGGVITDKSQIQMLDCMVTSLIQNLVDNLVRL